MADPRLTGLLLLLTGVLTLVGNTMDILPPQAFWAGLVTYPIGGYLFFIGSRRAIERAEFRTARALNPRIKNGRGEAFARQQEARVAEPNAPREVAADFGGDSGLSIRGEVVLSDIGAEGGGEDSSFEAASDVSFPLEGQQGPEGQEGQQVADQLEKLTKLQQQGLITAEEWAIAKAKLLR